MLSFSAHICICSIWQFCAIYIMFSVMRSVNTLAVLQVNSENDDDEEFERVQSLLSTLETLCDLCVHSRQCSQFIVNCFKISSVRQIILHRTTLHP